MSDRKRLIWFMVMTGLIIIGLIALVIRQHLLLNASARNKAWADTVATTDVKNCLGKDGANANLVEQVKSRLSNPETFWHLRTKIIPSKSGQHQIEMTFQAADSHGESIVFGLLNSETCQAEILVEPM